MNANKRPARRILLGAGAGALLVGCLAAGFVLGDVERPAPAHAAPAKPALAPPTESEPSTEQIESELSAGPDFPVNENGATYGVHLGPDSPDTAPDLIAVEMNDGSVGFVRKADFLQFHPVDVNSPEEALEWNRKLAEMPYETNEAGIRYFPLTAYEVDGETVIGTWEGMNAG